MDELIKHCLQFTPPEILSNFYISIPISHRTSLFHGITPPPRPYQNDHSSACKNSRLSFRHIKRSPRSLLHPPFLPPALCLLPETSYPTFVGIQASRFRSHAHTTSCRKQQRSLHFGRDDKQNTDSLTSSFMSLRRVVPLRGTLSCAFGAALLQGPTRIVDVTGD